LISLKLQLIFDKKKTFSSSPLLSIRLYLTIPLVVKTLGALGGGLGISRDVADPVLELFEPITHDVFPFQFLWSILLTWLFSEWVCRFQRWRVHPDFLA
jgi:hypothetical protein